MERLPGLLLMTDIGTLIGEWAVAVAFIIAAFVRLMRRITHTDKPKHPVTMYCGPVDGNDGECNCGVK